MLESASASATSSVKLLEADPRAAVGRRHAQRTEPGPVQPADLREGQDPFQLPRDRAVPDADQKFVGDRAGHAAFTCSHAASMSRSKAGLSSPSRYSPYHSRTSAEW